MDSMPMHATDATKAYNVPMRCDPISTFPSERAHVWYTLPDTAMPGNKMFPGNTSTNGSALLSERPRQLLVESVHEALGVKPWLVRTDEHGEILGHTAGLHGVDDHML